MKIIPTPPLWKIVKIMRRPEWPFAFALQGDNGFQPGLIFSDGSKNEGQALANAKRIVTAVNNHDGLVRTIGRLLTKKGDQNFYEGIRADAEEEAKEILRNLGDTPAE